MTPEDAYILERSTQLVFLMIERGVPFIPMPLTPDDNREEMLADMLRRCATAADVIKEGKKP